MAWWGLREIDARSVRSSYKGIRRNDFSVNDVEKLDDAIIHISYAWHAQHIHRGLASRLGHPYEKTSGTRGGTIQRPAHIHRVVIGQSSKELKSSDAGKMRRDPIAAGSRDREPSASV
jgi:hypothetical protein